MKKTLVLYIASTLIVFTGCIADNSEKIEMLTSQMNVLSEKVLKYEDMNSDVESLSDRLQVIEEVLKERTEDNQFVELSNELALMTESIADLQLELNFVEDTVYNHGLFNADEIKVGEYVGGMTLKEKNFYKDWRLSFSGEAELTGTYSISKNDDYWGRDMIFFDVNEERTENVLPRAIGDVRHFWFVIRNYDEAYDILISNGLEGEATIVIDNYLIDLLASDVVNEADIVRVIDFK